MGKDEQGLATGEKRYQLVPRTLCFVFHGDDVLLLKGATTKRLWSNRYNGIGGHLEPGEDISAAARREIQEETGLAVQGLRLCGVATVDIDPDVGIGLFIFSAQACHRHTIASSEGRLKWFPIARLPVEQMVKDVPVMLARIQAMTSDDSPFFAHYSYNNRDELIIRFAPDT